MAKKTCIICGKEIGALGRIKCKDGYICHSCWNNKEYIYNVVYHRGSLSIRNLTLEEIKEKNDEIIAQKSCLICGKKYSGIKYFCKDGYICKPCFKKEGYLQNVVKIRGIFPVKDLTLKEIEAINTEVESSNSIVKNFKPTYVPDKQIQFDDVNEEIKEKNDEIIAQKSCLICGKKHSGIKYFCRDGYICKPCFKKEGYLQNVVKIRGIFPVKDLTLKEIEAINTEVEFSTSIVKNFKPTYVPDKQIQFDDVNGVLIMSSKRLLRYKPEAYQAIRYDQIVGYELLKDGSSIASGGLGRAAVGGLLFGSTGAIVGASTRKLLSACSDLQIKITVKNYSLPSLYLQLITRDTSTNSMAYKNIMKIAQNVLSKLELIVINQQPVDTQEAAQSSTVADKLRELKALLDEKIITQEEFDQKKKQLLNL